MQQLNSDWLIQMFLPPSEGPDVQGDPVLVVVELHGCYEAAVTDFHQEGLEDQSIAMATNLPEASPEPSRQNQNLPLIGISMLVWLCPPEQQSNHSPPCPDSSSVV